MTLVAFTVQEHRAEIVTDSMSYSREHIDVQTVEKCHLFPAWDLAVAAIGPAELGDTWQELLVDCAAEVRDLDHLDELTPEALRALWLRIVLHRGGLDERESGRVFHVGWSPRRGRFVAYGYCLESEFERIDLTAHQLHVQPPPVSHVPPEIPTTNKQWAGIIKTCHADWSLISPMSGPRTFIGGDVVRTRLARGVSDQQTIHHFPDHGAQWRQSVIGTLHVDGQLGPCPCGSGLPYCACHLLMRDLTIDCPCESGMTLGACHAISPDDPQVKAHYLKHLKDYDRTRPGLAAAYRRARPQENWPPEQMMRLRGWRS